MFRNAKTLFYLNQYFVIRLGEKVYKYNSQIETLYVFRAFSTLVYNCFKLISFKKNDAIKKKYKQIVYIETINQKNAIIDVFNAMNDKKETLFILNNQLKIDGFDSIYFNTRKQFLLSLLYFIKAFSISKKYISSHKKNINGTHVLVNLSLLLASNKILEGYLKKTGCSKIILTNDHNLIPISLLLVSKRLKVTSYYIQHASVSPAFPKLLPDVALLEGQQAVDVYTEIGNLSRRIYLVGVSRLDGFLCFNKNKAKEELIVGFCLKPFYSKEIIDLIIQTILSIKKVKKIILRPHPGDDLNFYNQFLTSDSIEISNSKIERPHDYLKKVSIIISGESSIILEATLMKVKTYYIDDKVACFDLYGYIKNGITTFVENVEFLPQHIEQLEENEIEQQYNNAKYYCSTVNTEYENHSKELILRKLLVNDY
ncbi:hypothetical protein [Flavobacterium sp.]|uniref:hypothetical protein n=1 Tax=Flavobacterium sp. TaxID=239 RepID=UPI0025E279D7|nr:hypothetical protein [Flavobacterium sp.]